MFTVTSVLVCIHAIFSDKNVYVYWNTPAVSFNTFDFSCIVEIEVDNVYN